MNAIWGETFTWPKVWNLLTFLYPNLQLVFSVGHKVVEIVVCLFFTNLPLSQAQASTSGCFELCTRLHSNFLLLTFSLAFYEQKDKRKWKRGRALYWLLAVPARASCVGWPLDHRPLDRMCSEAWGRSFFADMNVSCPNLPRGTRYTEG